MSLPTSKTTIARKANLQTCKIIIKYPLPKPNTLQTKHKGIFLYNRFSFRPFFPSESSVNRTVCIQDQNRRSSIRTTKCDQTVKTYRCDRTDVSLSRICYRKSNQHNAREHSKPEDFAIHRYSKGKALLTM